MTITIHARVWSASGWYRPSPTGSAFPQSTGGAPTFNYEVDYFTIDRNGSLSF